MQPGRVPVGYGSDETGTATGRSTRFGSHTRQGRGVQGRYTERGPKGYFRSGERIEEEINETLARDPDLEASEIEVRVENGVVTRSSSSAGRQERHRESGRTVNV